LKKNEVVVSGQSKTLYESDKQENLVLDFRDEFTASSGRKRKISGRSESNNAISAFLMEFLESYHVPTHFVKRLNSHQMLVHRLEMIPIKVLIRNIATGKFGQRFKFKDGAVLDYPIIELYLKSGSNDEPFVNEHHLYALHYTTPPEMRTIERMASKINALLKSFFQRRNFHLVELSLEFGRNKGKLLVGDEISCETFIIWDTTTNEKYDPDYLNKEPKELEKIYKYLQSRILGGEEK
jgi:phosphoribosylaminoimidazole-succinocarboxamide synthase